jgi:hypothetical protein
LLGVGQASFKAIFSILDITQGVAPHLMRGLAFPFGRSCHHGRMKKGGWVYFMANPIVAG